MASESSLRKLFHLQSIAVVGASETVGKIGRTLIDNLKEHGFNGAVYPVNPNHSKVRRMVAYRDLESLSAKPDLAIFATPASGIAGMVRRCAEMKVGTAIVLAAGFGEIRAEGRRLEEELREARSAHPSLRVLGPNCLGIVLPIAKLNASFAHGMLRCGRVALLSQSGALRTAILDQAISESIGFSAVVSLRNMLDIGFADVLDYFASDPNTDAAILYVKSITEARRFMSAARAFSRFKPIVADKGGRFPQSEQAAASHTGAMTDIDAVYKAAFRRAGIVRALNFEELFDTPELLSRSTRLRAPNLAMISNAGGPAIMAIDALIAGGGTPSELSNEAISALDEILPCYWSHNNPVDLLGDATAQRCAKALQIVAKEADVDGVLVILTPQAVALVFPAWIHNQRLPPRRPFKINNRSFTLTMNSMRGIRHVRRSAWRS